MSNRQSEGFTPKERQSLFLKMAKRESGVSARDVYDAAVNEGDQVTVEAFHNLGRRLTHRGLLVAKKKEGSQICYSIGIEVEEQWLDEDRLAGIINPDYPLIGLTIWKETTRQLREIPENVWVEIRERLRSEPAQKIFQDAIMAYAEDLWDLFQDYRLYSGKWLSPKEPLERRKAIDNGLKMLINMTKYGLGLSNEALRLPTNFEEGLSWFDKGTVPSFYDEQKLKDELSRRIFPEKFILDVEPSDQEITPIVAAVDGSTRGGLLTLEAEEGDFSIGRSPMISINTAVAQLNREIQLGKKQYPTFIRLPEKPEDMQQRDNRYTIMAKIFMDDLSDSEYAHSLWAGMDVLESRAALKIMSRWYTHKENLEVPPADIILKDGTLTPNDRDFHHYKLQNSYGKVVRDLIEVNRDITRKCRDDHQTYAGIVKNAQLKVFGPVINWYACKIAAEKNDSQIRAWPLNSMNLIPDQPLLTRILTAGRKIKQSWLRSCTVMRPFHSTTNFGRRYSRRSGRTPIEIIESMASAAKSNPDSELVDSNHMFWQDFKMERDPYIQMLQEVWYAGFFLGAVPRLDIEKSLPRLELLVPLTTAEKGESWTFVEKHRSNLLKALGKIGFEVYIEHSMFASVA